MPSYGASLALALGSAAATAPAELGSPPHAEPGRGGAKLPGLKNPLPGGIEKQLVG